MGDGASQAQQGFDDIQDAANTSVEGLANAGEQAGVGFVSALTIALAAGAADFLNTMHETIDSAASYASNLGTLQIITGDSPKKLQELEYAMRGVGIDTGHSLQQFTFFQRSLERAGTAAQDLSSPFHKLGLDAKTMMGQDMVTSLQQVADKFATLKTATEKTTIAADLFGQRLGSKMVPLLEQGSKGLETAMIAADKFGAIIGGDASDGGKKLVEQLQALDEATLQLEQTGRAFYVSFAAPLVPVLTAIARAVQEVMAAFERLSESERLAALVGGLAASFLVLSKGIEEVFKFLGGAINPKILEFLTKFQIELYAVIIAGTLLYAAVQTNFAGMAQAVGPILQAIIGFLQRLWLEFQITGAIIQNVVGPAFVRLSDAIAPIVGEIEGGLVRALNGVDFGPITNGIVYVVTLLADFINWLATTIEENYAFLDGVGSVWNTAVDIIGGAINLIVAVIRDFISALVSISNWINDNRDVVDAFFSVIIAVNAVNAIRTLGFVLVALRTQLVATWALVAATDAWTTVTLLVEAFTAALSTSGLLGAVRALIVGLYDLGVAEAVASLGITAIIALAVYEVIENWNSICQLWDKTINGLSDDLANLETWLGRIIADSSNLSPLINFGNTLFQMGQDAKDAAQNVRDLAQAKEDLAFDDDQAGGGFGLTHKKHTADMTNMASGAWGDDGPKPPSRPPGTDLVPDAKKTPSSKGEATTAALDLLKDKVDAAKNAFAQAEDAVKRTDLVIQNLGKNAKPNEIAADYAAKMRAVQAETIAQLHLVQALAEAERSAKADAAKTSDKGEKRRFADFARSQEAERLAASTKVIELEGTYSKTRSEWLQKEIGYWSEIAGASSSTYDQQIKAQEQILALKKQDRDSDVAILAARLAIVNTWQAEAKAAADARSAQRSLQIEQIKAAGASRAEAVSTDTTGPGAAAAAREEELAKAQDDLHTAALAAANAIDQETLAKQFLAEMTRIEGAQGKDTIKANIDYITQEKAATVATAAFTLAQQKLNDLQKKTADDVLQTRDAFAKLINSGIGTTLVDIIKGLQDGTASLTQGFISLFQQSRSYYDIQEAFKEITSRLAQVFDAMRPVVDFLLGILIGITDIFLEMFNVLAELLNVFGLHIQKIQLLDSTLTGLNQAAQPLLEITHDLPTLNQYNAGELGNLAAQNETQNIMSQGFNQQLSKLGEIVGILIGAKVLLGIIAGHSVASQLGGVSSFIGKLFGGGKGSSSDDGGEDPGDNSNNDDESEDPGDNQSLEVAQSGNDLAQTSNEYLDDNNELTEANSTQLGILADVVPAGTTATTQLNSTMSSMLGILPSLLAIGGRALGGGGALGSLLGGAGGVLSTIFAKNAGVSTGKLDTGNYIQAGEELLQGLSPGGTFAQTLSGVGTAIGTAFGGPVIGSLTGMVAGFIGSFFGPHPNAQKDPDMFNTGVAQDVANLQGSGYSSAEGHTTENSTLSQIFGGQSGESAIEQELAKGMQQFMSDTGLSASTYQQDLSMFGSNAQGTGGLYTGKNVGDIGFSGVSGEQGTHKYSELETALEQFAEGLDTATGAMGALFGSGGAMTQATSTALDLAQIYGNGTNVTMPGSTAAVAPTFTVSFGDVYATNPKDFVNQVTPTITQTMETQARRMQQFSKNNQYSQGRF